jgi:hypothetical protein
VIRSMRKISVSMGFVLGELCRIEALLSWVFSDICCDLFKYRCPSRRLTLLGNNSTNLNRSYFLPVTPPKNF